MTLITGWRFKSRKQYYYGKSRLLTVTSPLISQLWSLTSVYANQVDTLQLPFHILQFLPRLPQQDMMMSCNTADVFQPSSLSSTNNHHIKVVPDVFGKPFTFRWPWLNGKGKRPFSAFICCLLTATSELRSLSPLEGHWPFKSFQLNQVWTEKTATEHLNDHKNTETADVA